MIQVGFLTAGEPSQCTQFLTVLERAPRDATLIMELGFKLKFALNTHCHADHITGTGYLKQLLPRTLSVIGKHANANADRWLEDGETVDFGRHKLKAVSTPGHTNGELHVTTRN